MLWCAGASSGLVHAALAFSPCLIHARLAPVWLFAFGKQPTAAEAGANIAANTVSSFLVVVVVQL